MPDLTTDDDYVRRFPTCATCVHASERAPETYRLLSRAKIAAAHADDRPWLRKLNDDIRDHARRFPLVCVRAGGNDCMMTDDNSTLAYTSATDATTESVLHVSPDFGCVMHEEKP